MSEEKTQVKEEEVKKAMGRPPRQDTDELVQADPRDTVISGLMERLEKLENPGIIAQPKKADRFFATLPTWEGNLVIGMTQARKSYDTRMPDVKEVVDIEATDVEGKRNKLTLPLLQFVEESVRILCEITGDEKRLVPVSKGKMPKMASGMIKHSGMTIADSASLDVPTGEQIDDVVMVMERKITLQVLDGDFKGKEFVFLGDETRVINA